MDKQDCTTRHFQGMIELDKALDDLPAEILLHQYNPEAFGSWFVIAQCNGIRLRVVFDGRDSMYILQRSTTRETPDSWQDTAWQMTEYTLRQMPIADIVAEVAKQANLPTQ